MDGIDIWRAAKLLVGRRGLHVHGDAMVGASEQKPDGYVLGAAVLDEGQHQRGRRRLGSRAAQAARRCRFGFTFGIWGGRVGRGAATSTDRAEQFLPRPDTAGYPCG